MLSHMVEIAIAELLMSSGYHMGSILCKELSKAKWPKANTFHQQVNVTSLGLSRVYVFLDEGGPAWTRLTWDLGQKQLPRAQSLPWHSPKEINNSFQESGIKLAFDSAKPRPGGGMGNKPPGGLPNKTAWVWLPQLEKAWPKPQKGSWLFNY